MLYLKIMILGGTNDFIMVLLIKKMIFPEYLFYKYQQDVYYLHGIFNINLKLSVVKSNST